MHNGPTRQGKKRTEEIFEIMMENFTQIKVRYQITDPGSSENTKRINAKKLQLGILFSDHRKSDTPQPTFEEIYIKLCELQ